MPLPLVFLAGVAIGVLAGLLGVGGGALLVPLMVLGFGSSTKTAASNSLGMILFSGIVVAVGYVSTGYGYLSISLPPLIVGALIGAWVGAFARNLFPEKLVRWGFAVLMVVVAL